MPYWIHDNGETLGPMRAIDVLRRAQPTTRICDGETWFRLDDGATGHDAPYGEADHREHEQTRSRVVIR
jgi:hypothetical protein